MDTINNVILSFGGNEENTLSCFSKAIDLIEKRIGRISKASKIYFTEPWGFDEKVSPFYNQVLEIKSKLSPIEVLIEIQFIEKKLGRSSKSINEKYKSRNIDIDILFYESLIIETKLLTIPHKLLHKRNFILVPLSEIYPDFVHPKLKVTTTQLLKNSKDRLNVQEIKRQN